MYLIREIDGREPTEYLAQVRLLLIAKMNAKYEPGICILRC